MIWLLASVAIGAVLAAEPSAESVLKQYSEAEHANWLRSREYTSLNKETHFFFDGQGKEKSSSSRTFEMIFVEGSYFRKLIARDDKPLSEAEAAKEEKRLKETAEERRREHTAVTQRNFTLASNDDLLNLYMCRVNGEESIQNRKAWVIQCDPQAGRKPANQHEKDVLASSRTLWIDEAEHVALKTVDTALEGHPVELPGSTVTNEFALVNGEVWMPVLTVMEGHLRIAKFIKPKVRTEYVNSNFKKFDVQSTVTPQ